MTRRLRRRRTEGEAGPTGSRRVTAISRFVPVLIGGALLAAACGSSGSDTKSSPSSVEAQSIVQIESSAREDVASALDDAADESFPDPIVDPEELRSGGPPPDGIPPIDDPRFVRVADVAFLEDREPVLAIDIDGEARAYPVQVMTWHEIVNDTIAGRPVTVSYCPLCNSAIAYDRRVDDRILDFGTSGMLWRSALVMYDRQTETLWSHYTGQAIIGHLAGVQLESIPVQTVSWGEFEDAHPDGLVLSRDTGFDRDYGRNPYPGYDDVGDLPFLYDGPIDGRYAAKTRILGIRDRGTSIAIPLAYLQEERVVEFEAGTDRLVAWHAPGTSSALSDAQVAEGIDVGTTGVFDTVVDGQRLSFEATGDGFRDRETRSRWSVLGHAIDGPMRGTQLTPIAHVDTFWFAWAAYEPATELIDA